MFSKQIVISRLQACVVRFMKTQIQSPVNNIFNHAANFLTNHFRVKIADVNRTLEKLVETDYLVKEGE